MSPEQVQAIRERMLRAVESEPGDFQCAKGEECEVCDGVLAVRQGAELLAALLADREQREGEIARLREALNDLELSDGAFRALVNAYLNPVSVTIDDQKWAAEALRPTGGEAGGGA